MSTPKIIAWWPLWWLYEYCNKYLALLALWWLHEIQYYNNFWRIWWLFEYHNDDYFSTSILIAWWWLHDCYLTLEWRLLAWPHGLVHHGVLNLGRSTRLDWNIEYKNKDDIFGGKMREFVVLHVMTMKKNIFMKNNSSWHTLKVEGH